MPVEIIVNGQKKAISPGQTVQGLLDQYGLAANRAIVEYNREILDRSQYASTTLKGGDVLEIVQFVGGG